jgi:hypothetical protein
MYLMVRGGTKRTILGAPLTKQDKGNPDGGGGAVALATRRTQLSWAAQSTNASKAGRAALALPWFAIATTTQRRPLAPCT